MDLTRRSLLKSLSAAGLVSALGAYLPPYVAEQPASQGSPSSLDELLRRSIVIDDISGFEPKSNLPDRGFSVVNDSGITVVSPTLGSVVPAESYESSLSEIAKQIDQIGVYADRMMLIRNASDIEKAKKENKLGVLINFQNSTAIGTDLHRLDLFYDLGVRQIQLTFNWRNWVGDGCIERTQAGLSYFGVDMVHRMNDLGILVDVSHTGYQSTLDAVEVSRVPIVYSHTNCKALCDHPRNKTDEQIRALAKRGGVMGLSCFNWFVSDKPRSTLDDLLDHFDHVRKLVGVDFIGIGSDFSIAGWPGKAPDAQWEEHKKIYNARDWRLLKGRFPPYIDAVNGPQRYRVIAQGLRRRGYSTGDLEKILGLNFMRVYKQVLKAT